MKQDYADANPNKAFFLQMFTRDISLEDCILDLIDNSIDSLFRSGQVVLDEILNPETQQSKPTEANLPKIQVTISADEISIKDNCGGITYKIAKEEIFKFGHSEDQKGNSLGVYGIGLKRAMFKIGKKIHMKSKNKKDGFVSGINTDEWLKDDQWRIPIQRLEGVGNDKRGYTEISISKFNDEVKEVVKSSMLPGKLYQLVAKTYTFFLNKSVNIEINGTRVDPVKLSFSTSEDIEYGYVENSYGDVNVKIYVGLAARVEGKDKKYWSEENAGWFIACNGRLVLFADRSELTGWGKPNLPAYQPQYRGFLGVVFFSSKNPLQLPWTTTKRALNKESLVYQQTFKDMVRLAKPVISTLQKVYKGGEGSEREEYKKMADSADIVTVETMKPSAAQLFTTKPPKIVPTTTSIQFDYNKNEVDRIKHCLKKPGLSNKALGKKALDYFAEMECPQMSAPVGSWKKVNYQLRPAKQLERRIMLDTFIAMAQCGFRLRKYKYIGFGSIFFYDFVLFHKLLGIDKMLSIEHDYEAESRVQFNKPFRDVEIKMGRSDEILPVMDMKEEYLAWFGL